MEKETLQEIGMKFKTDKSTYHKYCNFYQENLPGRDFKGRLLEIGIMDGASLRMWREYFYDAEIIGIDIHIRPKRIDGVRMIKMDATDINAVSKLGMLDIIIEDASHMTKDQQITFNHMYHNQLNEGGFFVMEDCHTSNIPSYVNTPETTYDMMKRTEGAIEYNGNEGQSITFIIPKPHVISDQPEQQQ